MANLRFAAAPVVVLVRRAHIQRGWLRAIRRRAAPDRAPAGERPAPNIAQNSDHRSAIAIATSRRSRAAAPRRRRRTAAGWPASAASWRHSPALPPPGLERRVLHEGLSTSNSPAAALSKRRSIVPSSRRFAGLLHGRPEESDGSRRRPLMRRFDGYGPRAP